MNATLAELLENLKSGLLWVRRDGVVRHANSIGSERTALAAGRRVGDPDLARAVAQCVASGVPGKVTAMGRAAGPGVPVAELQCRVLPGLTRDDAFVLIAAEDAADHAAAYDDLMTVIRSDLRDPLDHARQALALARDGEPHAIDALVHGVEELTQVLDKLLDLASLWRSGALLANDRIELWPLIQQVWSEIEPAAIDRNVKVRFRTQSEQSNLPTLYGSEKWLRRVMLECLEAALRSSRQGATIDIEHRQMGPRALFVFRDCGAFASRNADAIELGRKPGRGSAPVTPKAREHIGLKLCTHIVSMHGGQLREEVEDGVRNFLIELPTGAPHRGADAQVDIAQVQQYARDLAALIGRSRRRPAAA